MSLFLSVIVLHISVAYRLDLQHIVKPEIYSMKYAAFLPPLKYEYYKESVADKQLHVL